MSCMFMPIKEPKLIAIEFDVAEPQQLSKWDAIPGQQSKPSGRIMLNHNDPSAGSPTETLLRLVLPLNDRV